MAPKGQGQCHGEKSNDVVEVGTIGGCGLVGFLVPERFEP